MSAIVKIPVVQGTPKTLREAVGNGIRTARGREVVEQFRMIIQDFLAQKFSTAMLEHPECEDVLSDLFAQCTKDGSNV